MKKILALVLAVCLSLGLLAGCAGTSKEETATAAAGETNDSAVEATTADKTTAEPETKIFTDSLGREVEVPYHIQNVAVSGPLAQIILFAICPDNLVGLATEWDETAGDYIDSKYLELPVLGQLYGGKGDLNLETLLASGAEVIIDVGEPKDSTKKELDDLQEQTGIPFVHITASISTMDDAYRMLGELLEMEEEAEEIAAYCDKVYERTEKIASSVEKVNLLYITGDAGLNVIAQGSYHSEVIDLLSNNLAVVDEPSSRGTGNEVDMEQILLWNPDYIIISPGSIYDTIGDDATWQQITAIKNGNYYEVPFGPHNWMGFPPSVQRYLGMTWMAKLLYPDEADYDLYEEVAEYYELFYHCVLTEEQYSEMVKNSIGK